MKKIFLTAFFLILTVSNLFAARSHTVVNTAGSPVYYTMRDTITMTLRVTNTNTGNDATLSINRVTFTFSNTTMLINTTGHTAPTGWTFTVDTVNNSITFNSTSASYNITTNNYKDFVVSLYVVASNLDSGLEYMTSSVARYTNNKNSTVNSPSGVSWYRKGLKIVSMIATPDLLSPGDTFTLTITVQNVSSQTQTNITAVPNPPAETQTGGFNPNTTSNPSIASLGVLATSTLVYNYTTDPGFTGEGTVYFTCSVRNGANNTTSLSANSNIVYIGMFIASITFTPECPLSGETVNVTMTLTNNNVFALSNVTPYLSVYGTATAVKLTGPIPATTTLNPGQSVNITYTYQITGSYDASFYFSGYATGQKTTPPTGTRQTPTYTTTTRYLREYSLGLVPNTITGGAKNFFLKFSLQNKANAVCPIDTNYDVKKISITVPSGFAYSVGNFSYLIGNTITDTNNPDFEYYDSNWTVVDTSNPISFTSNNAAYNLPTGKNATFSLFFNSAPKVSADTIYTFLTTVENVKGSSINFSGSNVQITVTKNPTGITKKPSPTKGGVREKHE